MKRGTVDHPKMLDFAECIHAHLVERGIAIEFDFAHSAACGIMERLWHYAARYAPSGNVGKHSDARIARAVGWSFDDAWLIATLTRIGWLDTLEGADRLFVHDWHQHADDAADKWLCDKDLRYANGESSRRKKTPVATSRDKSRPSRDKSSQSEPEPEPSSEPKPKSKPLRGGACASLVLADLRETPTVLAWAARELGDPLSEADRLRVVGAAERALEVGENPCALFVAIVTERNWGVVNASQEARAEKRLKGLNKPPPSSLAEEVLVRRKLKQESQNGTDGHHDAND